MLRTVPCRVELDPRRAHALETENFDERVGWQKEEVGANDDWGII